MTGIKARATWYKGIEMRSRLEADFAAFLDGVAKVKFDYEPFCFAGPDGQWLPDFRVQYEDKTVYFEVKPASLPDDQIDQTLEQMTVAWLTEPNAILQLVIWYYGEPLRSFSLMGIPEAQSGNKDVTWWYAQGDGEASAWPGMGQLEHFVELAQQEREGEEREGQPAVSS
jgi:hypothetical protein